MTEISDLSIAAAGAGIRCGDFTALELTEALLGRIARFDPRLRNFFLLTAERARADAARADAELRVGQDRGPLHGIAYGLKDIIATRDFDTTCNSHLFVGHKPSEDAAVETRLQAAGAVLLGKLSTSEFACGGPSEDQPYPVSRNPWNPEHYTGGSSSGSAGAVAVRQMRFAIGTDTGGSIRVPAAYCGVVGLKPTYGRVSTRGVFPLSPSLDHCGTLACSVEDTALVLNAIAGFDPADPASVDRPAEDFTRDLKKGVKGLKLGYARQFLVDAKVLPELVSALDKAVEILRQQGAQVEEVTIPDFELFRACNRVIIAAEAFALHEHTLRTRPKSYGRLTYVRLIAGTALSAGDLVNAFRLRRELTVGFTEVMARFDAIVTSPSMGEAVVLDTKPAASPPPMTGAPTVIGNVTGNPAMTVPIALSKQGLPLGMQIFGGPFAEATVLRIGAALEDAVAFPAWPEPASYLSPAI